MTDWKMPAMGEACWTWESMQVFSDFACKVPLGGPELEKFYSDIPPGIGIQGCNPIPFKTPDGNEMTIFGGNLCEQDSVKFAVFMDPECKQIMDGAPQYEIPFKDGYADCWTPDGKTFLSLYQTGWPEKKEDGKGATLDATTDFDSYDTYSTTTIDSYDTYGFDETKDPYADFKDPYGDFKDPYADFEGPPEFDVKFDEG